MRAQSVGEEARGVTVGTIHSAKGLEWDTVFVVRCNNDILPMTPWLVPTDKLKPKQSASVLHSLPPAETVRRPPPCMLPACARLDSRDVIPASVTSLAGRSRQKSRCLPGHFVPTGNNSMSGWSCACMQKHCC